MVDAHLRSKTIETADIKNLLIGGQTGIDGIRFCLAAVTNGENLADPAFSWFLQYKNKNGQGESVGLTPVYENSLVKLPWVPNKLATQVPGRMQIQLYAAIITGEGEAAVVDKQWVSEFAIIYIQENINPDPIVATEPSVIEYYVTLYAAYKNAAEAAAAAALESEQASGTSEDNAADSAYAAEQAALAAGDSASSAAQSAGLANTSKNAAAGSASEAAGSAAGALASKQAAATSETNAAGHAAEALASKNAAGVSEGNASDSKQKAQKWAEEEKDVEVEPGKFSAKHWMEKASGVYDNFDARFLGYKDADPAVDNKGNALAQGALYFNSVSKMLRLHNGTAWGDLANSAAGITYSGAASGLEGTNVQAAIDELDTKKVKITKMPDGSAAIYSQDAWATVDGWSSGGGGTLSIPEPGILRITANSTLNAYIAKNIISIQAKTVILRYRCSNDSTGFRVFEANGTLINQQFGKSTDWAIAIVTVPAVFPGSLLLGQPAGYIVGSWFEIDWIWIGDYNYLTNSLSNEGIRIANQLGDTAGVGIKASGNLNVSFTIPIQAGDTVSISGKIYNYVPVLSGSFTEGEVLVGSDAYFSHQNLLNAIFGVNIGITNWCTAHPLVVMSRPGGGGIGVLTAKKAGALGNFITLSTNAPTRIFLSGSTLTGGTDDIGEKIRNQLVSLNWQWVFPTMLNGWTSESAYPVGYMVDAVGIIHFRGFCTGGTLGLPAFTIPSAQCPSVTKQFVTYSWNGSSQVLGMVQINSSGLVSPIFGSSIRISFNEISLVPRS